MPHCTIYDNQNSPQICIFLAPGISHLNHRSFPKNFLHNENRSGPIPLQGHRLPQQVPPCPWNENVQINFPKGYTGLYMLIEELDAFPLQGSGSIPVINYDFIDTYPAFQARHESGNGTVSQLWHEGFCCGNLCPCRGMGPERFGHLSIS